MVLGLLGRGAAMAAKALMKKGAKKAMATAKKGSKATDRHTAAEARKLADSKGSTSSKASDYIFEKDIKNKAQSLRDAKAPSKDIGPSRRDRGIKKSTKTQATKKSAKMSGKEKKLIGAAAALGGAHGARKREKK